MYYDNITHLFVLCTCIVSTVELPSGYRYVLLKNVVIRCNENTQIDQSKILKLLKKIPKNAKNKVKLRVYKLHKIDGKVFSRLKI